MRFPQLYDRIGPSAVIELYDEWWSFFDTSLGEKCLNHMLDDLVVRRPEIASALEHLGTPIARMDYLKGIQRHGVEPTGLEFVWISSDMTTLIVHAAASMPKQVFLPTDIPIRKAFVLFEVPVEWSDIFGDAPRPHDDAWDEIHHIVGLSWIYMHFDPDGGSPSSLDHVFIELYAPFGSPGPRIYQCPGVRTGFSLGDPSDPPLFAWEQEATERFCAALWTLMQQRLSIVAQSNPERHARRRLEKKRSPVAERLITTITLRELNRHHSEHGVEASKVAWTHRWLVSGYWRNQWLSNVRAHRLQWVAPYTKGPVDKPLILKRRLYKLAR